MKNFNFFFLFLACSLNIYSQTDSTANRDFIQNEKFGLHHTSFYVSTDLLSLLQTAITPDELAFSFSGEVCIDHRYGLQLTSSLETERTHFKRTGFILRPEFRWYGRNDNCSAFHLGAYCSFEEATVIIELHSSSPSYLKYKEENTSYHFTESELVVRIALQVGYRF